MVLLKFVSFASIDFSDCNKVYLVKNTMIFIVIFLSKSIKQTINDYCQTSNIRHTKYQNLNITLASWWTRWRLKSPASALFTQLFIQLNKQGKNLSIPSLAFVWGIHQWSVKSPHKGPVMRKMFPFDDVIMMFLVSSSSCLGQSVEARC